MQISISITGSRELEQAFNKFGTEMTNFSSAMNEIGTELSTYYQTKGFASQGGVFRAKWPRLSKRYSKTKAKRYSGRPILIASGKMQSGFRHKYNSTSAEIYNRMPYAKYHQFGTSRLPQRKIIGVNKDVRDKVQDIIEHDINKKLIKLRLK